MTVKLLLFQISQSSFHGSIYECYHEEIITNISPWGSWKWVHLHRWYSYDMTSDIQYDSIGVVTNSWLVGGFKHELFDFPYIGNVIIPTDELIFFRGVGQPPTSWSCNQVFFGGRRWTVLWKWDDVERINGTHNMSRLWSMIGSVRLKAHRIYIISLNLSYSSTNPVGFWS